MDYFITADAFVDIEETFTVPALGRMQAQFTEQLVQMAGIGVYLYQPVLPAHLYAAQLRADEATSAFAMSSHRQQLLIRLGLTRKGPILFCPQVDLIVCCVLYTQCMKSRGC